MRTLAALAISISFAAAAPAVSAPAGKMLVTTDWLKANLTAPNIVVLHVGDKAAYDAGHIPGARLLPANALSAPLKDGLQLEMLGAEDLRRNLEALGVSKASRIVLYSGDGAVPSATRAHLALDAAGFGGQTSLLDGGLAAWKAQGNAASTEAAKITPSKLAPLKMQARTVDADTLKARMQAKGYKVVDARAPIYYDGVQPGGMPGEPHPKGHIPGAVNVPFTVLTGPDQKVRPVAELQRAFTAAGVKPGDKLMVYCHVGWQGTAVVFAARMLGYEAVLYDGSFQDWSKRKLPVEMKAGR